MVKKHCASLAVVLAFLAMTAAGLISCKQAPKPIKIGLSINLSGRGGTAGEYIRDGALLGVEDINATGGINGRPIELLIEDDLNTKEGILAADGRLIDQGVIAIIGHSFSQNTVIAHPFVTGRNTMLFTPYTATTQLTGQDDLFCRTAVDDNLYGKALAALLNQCGINNVAFLLDMSNQSFVEDYLEHTTPHFSGTVAVERFNSKKEVDWPQIEDGLLANNPQAIVMLTEVSMTGIGAQKLAGRGFSGELIASVWAQSPDLMRFGGKAVEGMTLITFINPNLTSPEYLKFTAKMLDKFNKPATARSARAYEAIQILGEALRSCPANPTPADLKAALLASRFSTLLGPVSFDASCDVDRPVYAVRIEDGRFINSGEIRIE